MAARTGNAVLDLALLIGGYYIFTHPSTGLDAEAALAYQEAVLIPSRKNKDIAKLKQLLKTAQTDNQTAAATTIQAYLAKLEGGLGGAPPSGGGSGGSGQAPPSRTTYAPAALANCTNHILRVGSAGPCVSAVQARLNQLIGADLPTGGHFEGNLEAAVRRFQAQQRITVDGIVGPQTWSRLLHPQERAATPAVHPGIDGRPTGAFGVPTTWPKTLRIPAGQRVPAGYRLYVADNQTAWYNLGLSQQRPVYLAVWDPPSAIVYGGPSEGFGCAGVTMYLGLGRAYYVPSTAVGGLAVLSPYVGVAQYANCRRVNVYAQARHDIGPNQLESPLQYRLAGGAP